MSEVIEAPAAAPAAPAAAPAAAAPAAPAPAAAPAGPAPSLLKRGASEAPPAPAAAPAAPAAPASPIPAKYHVKREDGSIDEAASIAKWSDGHKALEQRLGAGDAPPQTPEAYEPKVPAGLKLEDLKADPLFNGFLKGAHARGMTNAHVSYVLEAMAEREAMRNSPELAEPELRKVWVTDDQMKRGLSDAWRATNAFAAGDEPRMQRIEAKFANDPDFLWLMAQVGKELHEDPGVDGALSASETETLESLMASKAYMDAKHPEHAQTVARVQRLYQKRFPT